jgi:hypothetical protein
MIMEDSILKTIKTMLGLNTDETCFDTELIVMINSTLSTLNSIGVGPEEGLQITGEDETWNSLLGNRTILNEAKTYVYVKVKLMFDPPANSWINESMKKTADEYEWRMSAKMDTIKNKENEGE